MMLFGKYRSKLEGHRDKMLQQLEVHGSALARPQRDYIERAIRDGFYNALNELDELEENNLRVRVPPRAVF